MPDDTEKVMRLIDLAHSLDRKDSSLKYEYAGRAINLAQQLHWNNGIVRANCAMGKLIRALTTDMDRAMVYFRRAISAGIGDRTELSYTYNLIASAWDKLNGYDSALLYYQKALDVNPEARQQIGLLANIGAVNNDLGDYLFALDHYSKALKLNGQILAGRTANRLDSQTHVGLLFCTGDIYLQMQQYDDALSDFQAGLKLNTWLREPFLDIKALQGIGQSYYAKTQYEMSISCYLKALQKADSIHYARYRAEILGELGMAYFAIGKFDNALASENEAIRLIRDIAGMPVIAKIYINLGRLYAFKGDYVKAINYLQQSVTYSAGLGTKPYERDGWHALSETYEKAGNPGKALEAYKNFVLLRDSIFNVEKVKRMKGVEMQLRLQAQHLTDSLNQAVVLQRERVKRYPVYAGLAIAISLVFFVLIGYYRQRKNNRIIQQANQAIVREQKISEDLLLNILPSDVALELKADGHVKAKQFDRVTVLFTDFVNFTRTAEYLTPQELVAELDACFKAFDEIVGRYQVEKIKTVGDAYLAVGGLPVENAQHALNVVKAAIEIRDFMLRRRAEMNEASFEIRLGIHSGTVIAGVVGVKKFAYDIWGDTVNTAARLEQNSEPGKINLSADTYNLVKDQIACVYRGELPAKNKGHLKMYFVE